MTLQLDRVLMLGGSLVIAAVVAAPAAAQDTRERVRETSREAAQETREATREARQATERSGNAVKDSWITMKVHSQFVPEDALEDSDIDVETNAGVVTLTGTVPTAAGKTRAVAIAKATDGVTRVTDRLRIAPEDAEDLPAAAAGAAGATGAAAREGARETREAGRRAGSNVSDGWLTSKIYAQFITEDALEDSDIDVETERGVVTLTGTAPTKAGATRAEQIAKMTDGVQSVSNKITVKP